MATWTVNTNDDGTYVDTDNHVGSLRGCIGAAASGDTIIFDDTVFPANTETTILIETSLPSKYGVEIDGRQIWNDNGTMYGRVVIDGQGAVTCFEASSSDFKLTNLKLYNGAGPAGGGGVRVTSGSLLNPVVLNNVIFDTCKRGGGNGGGAVYGTSTSHCVFNNCFLINNIGAFGGAVCQYNCKDWIYNNCVFKGNNNTGSGGGVYFYESASATFNSCTFENNSSQNGGGVYFASKSTAIFNNPIFSGNSATSNAADIYLAATTTATINGGTFNTPQSGDNVYNSSTAENALTLNNLITVDKLKINASSTTVINGTLTADVLTVSNGAAVVTFSGVDSILAVTTTATIGAATFTAAANSTGYAAFPAGTDTSAATFTGVNTAIYGAGASDFHAQITSATTASLSWTQTDSDVPVLLEAQESESDTWTTLSTSATSPYTVTDDDIDDLTFRIFDGESFYTAAGSYTFAKFYQVVAGYVPRNNDTTPHSWQTVIKLLTVNEMNENLKPGQDCAILARVYDAFDNDSPLLNLGSNISSVYYTCEKKMKSLYDAVWTPVTGHNNVSAGADCVLSSLQTDDAWDIDNVGYNFLLSPEISTHQLFETAGLYRIKATINPVDGDPITFYKEINVVE